MALGNAELTVIAEALVVTLESVNDAASAQFKYVDRNATLILELVDRVVLLEEQVVRLEERIGRVE